MIVILSYLKGVEGGLRVEEATGTSACASLLKTSARFRKPRDKLPAQEFVNSACTWVSRGCHVACDTWAGHVTRDPRRAAWLGGVATWEDIRGVALSDELSVCTTALPSYLG